MDTKRLHKIHPSLLIQGQMHWMWVVMQ